MSHKANVAVWEYAHPDLTPHALLVLVALADYANPDSALCWPSLARIAARVHLSRSTVIRCLSELEAVGQIARVRRGGGRGTPTVYRFALVDNVGTNGVTLTPFPVHKRFQNGPETVSKSPINGFTGGTQNRINPKGTENPKRHARHIGPTDMPDPDPDLAAKVAEVRARLRGPS
jgi:hypothetical protein